MEIQKDLCNNELRKAGLLLLKATDLGLNLSSDSVIGVNTNTGNVYLYSENYPFTLFIDLGSDDIQACWTNYNDDDQEEFINVDSMTLYQLEEWCKNNDKEANLV